MPYAELPLLLAAILAAGVISGLLAGLFGIGGGAIIVPVLYEAFRLFGVPEEVRIQLCVGTSLAIMVPTTFRSYLTHRAKGPVLPGVLRLWAPACMLGVAIGAVIAAVAPSAFFKLAFVAIAGFIAAKLLFANERWVIRRSLPGRLAMSGYGALIGLASSLMGIAGGSLATMVLTLYGTPIHAAVATSAGLGAPITLAGAVGYMFAGWPQQALMPPLSVGFVSFIGLAVMAPISTAVAPMGARLAHRLPRRALEIGFGLFLLAASLRFVVSMLLP